MKNIIYLIFLMLLWNLSAELYFIIEEAHCDKILTYLIGLINFFFILLLSYALKTYSSKIRRELSQSQVEKRETEEKQAQYLKELKRMNEELNEFVYIVSHDLKSPLSSMALLTNILSLDYVEKLGKQGKELIHALIEGINRMYNLINGILRYTKVGWIKEEKEKINMNDIVKEAIEIIVPPKDIEIKVDKLPYVWGLRTSMIQLFQNLLSNAVKYMDKPKGEIKIGYASEDKFWKFWVCDNGLGIEEKYFETIFKLFQTLEIKDSFESTGIGLTIVKKIVEKSEGQVWVESKVDLGSCFFFTLPKEK